MSARVVQLRLGGQTYRFNTTATEDELQRLAAVVHERLGGRPATAQNLFLAALALAHDLEEADARVATVRTRSREVATGLLGRVDSALARLPGDAPDHGVAG